MLGVDNRVAVAGIGDQVQGVSDQVQDVKDNVASVRVCNLLSMIENPSCHLILVHQL